MLVVIMDLGYGKHYAVRTEQQVRKLLPEAGVVTVSEEIGQTMNQLVQKSDTDYLMTLFAGDELSPELCNQLPEKLQLLDADCGVLLKGREQEEEPVRPIIWRIKALQDGTRGFADRKALPFERYVLIERLLHLNKTWSCQQLKLSDIKGVRYPKLRWQHLDEEWALVAPLLPPSPIYMKRNQPVISIVICVYEDTSYLPWAIRSVMNQTISDWELIIVNDGGSVEELQQVLLPYQGDDRITVIHHERNLGKAASLNTALEAVTTDWFLELDADDWLVNNCLEIFVKWSSEADEQDALLCACHHVWLELPSQARIVYQQRSTKIAFDERDILAAPEPLAPRCYRTAAVRDMGGWWTSDVYSGRLYEDIQMLVRMNRLGRLKGYELPLYHRRLRHNSITKRNQDKYEIWRMWLEHLLVDS